MVKISPDSSGLKLIMNICKFSDIYHFSAVISDINIVFTIKDCWLYGDIFINLLV